MEDIHRQISYYLARGIHIYLHVPTSYNERKFCISKQIHTQRWEDLYLVEQRKTYKYR